MAVSGAFGGSKKIQKKWRLFRATDYISLMRLCFEVLRIEGLFPYKITSGSTIVSSKPGYIYSTLITIMSVIATGVTLYDLNVSQKLTDGGVPDYLQINCYMLLGWAVGMITYIYSWKRMRLLSDLAEVSSKLPASSFTQITKIIHAKSIFGSVFVVLQMPTKYSGDTMLAIRSFLTTFISVVVYSMDTLYVDSVCVLRSCFERINDNLLTLKESIDKEEPHLLRRVYHEQKNPLILLEIRAMKKQHNAVSEVVQCLNSTFSLQIVATVTLTFAEITFSLYFYIVRILTPASDDGEKQILYPHFIITVLYYVLKLASIVWACETAKSQATRTGIIVHEILIDTTDKQVKEELQLFSLQLLHRDNTFQAKGLSLDATLVTAIVGGITTYLLILIQFLVSPKSCTASTNSTDVTTLATTI